MNRLQQLRDQLEHIIYACLKTEKTIVKPEPIEDGYLNLFVDSDTNVGTISLLSSLVANEQGPYQPLYGYLLDVYIHLQHFLEAPHQETQPIKPSQDIQMKICMLFIHLKQLHQSHCTESNTLHYNGKSLSLMGLKPGWLQSTPLERELISQLFSKCGLSCAAEQGVLTTAISDFFWDYHIDTIQIMNQQLKIERDKIESSLFRIRPLVYTKRVQYEALNNHSSHTNSSVFFLRPTNPTSNILNCYEEANSIKNPILKNLYIQYHNEINQNNRLKETLLQYEQESTLLDIRIQTLDQSKERARLEAGLIETPVESENTNQQEDSAPLLIASIVKAGWDWAAWALSEIIVVPEQQHQERPDVETPQLEQQRHDAMRALV